MTPLIIISIKVFRKGKGRLKETWCFSYVYWEAALQHPQAGAICSPPQPSTEGRIQGRKDGVWGNRIKDAHHPGENTGFILLLQTQFIRRDATSLPGERAGLMDGTSTGPVLWGVAQHSRVTPEEVHFKLLKQHWSFFFLNFVCGCAACIYVCACVPGAYSLQCQKFLHISCRLPDMLNRASSKL